MLDNVCGHLTDRVKTELREACIHLAVIPGSLIGMLQSLDVSVNQPFKVKFRRCYTEWMVSSNHEKTSTERLRKAPLATVAEWILGAWSSVSLDIVAKNFKVIGISNNLDGAEDDFM